MGLAWGGGSGKSAFPGHGAGGGRFQKREVLGRGRASCGCRQPGIGAGMANQRGGCKPSWPASFGQGSPGSGPTGCRLSRECLGSPPLAFSCTPRMRCSCQGLCGSVICASQHLFSKRPQQKATPVAQLWALSASLSNLRPLFPSPSPVLPQGAWSHWLRCSVKPLPHPGRPELRSSCVDCWRVLMRGPGGCGHSCWPPWVESAPVHPNRSC